MTADEREWIEIDGLGGFASGTPSGIRARRYHALLVHATTPPTGRMVLVNGFDAWVEIDGVTTHLTSQRYAPDVVHPDGASRLEHFTIDPWPTWRWRISDVLSVTQELFMPHKLGGVVLRWQLGGPATFATLHVRPFLSGRDYHALHHENPAFDFTPTGGAGHLEWHPYPGVPGVRCRWNGGYLHWPSWYRQFLYTEERARGLDDVEDLASPAELRWNLLTGAAVCVFDTAAPVDVLDVTSIVDRVAQLRQIELQRRAGVRFKRGQSASYCGCP